MDNGCVSGIAAVVGKLCGLGTSQSSRPRDRRARSASEDDHPTKETQNEAFAACEPFQGSFETREVVFDVPLLQTYC
eukprot:708750-Amphidinium_carterae.1